MVFRSHSCTTVLPGLSLGSMGRIDQPFDAVLTVAATPGLIPNGVRHRHLPIPEGTTDLDLCATAADWVVRWWNAEQHVLIRDEDGQRSSVIAALAILNFGGSRFDVLHAMPHLETSPYLPLVRRHEQRLLDQQIKAHG